MLLLFACRQSSRDAILEHPAITLLKVDQSVAFFEPTWSPDEMQLAVTGARRCYTGRCPQTVYILDIGSGEYYSLTTSGSESAPEWTSAPEIISFVKDGTIYTIGTDGNRLLPLTPGLLASWSRDGRFVAVVRQNRETGLDSSFTYKVEVLDVKMGDERPIFETRPKTEQEDRITGLAWSPDSAQIAISARLWTAQTYTDSVFVVNANGSDLRRVSTNATSVGWMPDGTWLYFLTYEKGGTQLSFAPLSFDCVLTPLELPEIRDPVIAPSGEQMAFVHYGNIYLLDLTWLFGTNSERLTCTN